jgi:hypothetical protein
MPELQLAVRGTWADEVGLSINPNSSASTTGGATRMDPMGSWAQQLGVAAANNLRAVLKGFAGDVKVGKVHRLGRDRKAVVAVKSAKASSIASSIQTPSGE